MVSKYGLVWPVFFSLVYTLRFNFEWNFNLNNQKSFFNYRYYRCDGTSDSALATATCGSGQYFDGTSCVNVVVSGNDNSAPATCKRKYIEILEKSSREHPIENNEESYPRRLFISEESHELSLESFSSKILAAQCTMKILLNWVSKETGVYLRIYHTLA